MIIELLISLLGLIQCFKTQWMIMIKTIKIILKKITSIFMILVIITETNTLMINP